MALKMTREHQEYIKEAIETTVEQLGGWRPLIEWYETGYFADAPKTENIQLKFIWAVFHVAVDLAWVRDNLYPYLNDGNIYNAVKKMVPTLVDRRPADRRPAKVAR